MSRTRCEIDSLRPTSLRTLLLQGMDLFDEQLLAVTDADLGRATPCSEWDVEALVRHTADTADRATAILRGETWVASTSRAPVKDRWNDAAVTLCELLADIDLDDRWPLPDDSPNAKLQFHGCDFTVHRWDLARALGEEPVLPSGWVDYMDGFFESVPAEALRRPRAFEPPVEPASTDGPTERLMAFLGRSTRS
ncbi:TIGR03086 family metal-binding protein [Rhodococcus sp. USK13]|uniref:TIGR03086 family metal-binding protein n=1 Tax=Rhodococcus sp. USK13 TaxID=2806442 RepID=UPI001BCAAF70|nr:TIGR03086 family metal-binding protein [Rhodococcus sp. USK13]